MEPDKLLKKLEQNFIGRSAIVVGGEALALALGFAFIFEQGNGDGKFFAAYAALVRAEQVDLAVSPGL